MTLCNTAEGLFEAPLKTIYIPFRYLTSGDFGLLQCFRNLFVRQLNGETLSYTIAGPVEDMG